MGLLELPFQGFEKTSAQRIREWKDTALNLLSKTGNTCLVASTGSGKTIIACLLILATGKRALFLVPKRSLGIQQQASFASVTAGQMQSRVIIGETRRSDRNWLDPNDRAIFSTPQTVLAEMKRNPESDILRSFELIVIDEVHMARGEYDYTTIARLATERGVSLLGLTASPGKNIEVVERLRKVCGFDQMMPVRFQMPPKLENRIEIPLSPALEKIEADLKGLILFLSKKMREDGITSLPDKEEVPTVEELKSTMAEVNHEAIVNNRDLGRIWTLRTQAASLFKLRVGYNMALTCSFRTFIDYDQRLRTGKPNRYGRPKKSRADQWIIERDAWKNAIEMAASNADHHPKVEAFLEELTETKASGQTCLVFAESKFLVNELTELARGSGFRAAGVTGAQKARDQRAATQALDRRELDVLFTTSVCEVGLSIWVPKVVNYTMPTTEIGRIQRSGRTGRVETGRVTYLTLKHPSDLVPYWSTRAGEKASKQIVDYDGSAPPVTTDNRKKKKPASKSQLHEQFALDLSQDPD